MSSDRARQPGPGPLRYHFLRLGLKALVLSYLRVRLEGTERLPPTGAYIICFNHPSWLDPFVIVGCWPRRGRRVFVLGPREEDMSRGFRNRLIRWSRLAVPLRPEGRDVLDMTRRALEVLRGDVSLAIAGEGRLSDHEAEPLPLETGVAHLAMLAGVPVLPVALIGTRWVHLRSVVRVRIGEPIATTDFGRGRQAARELTAAVEASLRHLLAGVQDSAPPGPLGRYISELFNERPWPDE